MLMNISTFRSHMFYMDFKIMYLKHLLASETLLYRFGRGQQLKMNRAKRHVCIAEKKNLVFTQYDKQKSNIIHDSNGTPS